MISSIPKCRGDVYIEKSIYIERENVGRESVRKYREGKLNRAGDERLHTNRGSIYTRVR